MKYLLPALLIVFLIYTVSSYSEPVVGNNVNDFTFYNSNFYLAFNNGTIASIGEGKLNWVIEVGDRGVPVHISLAPPYGILVLTDRAWLGLVSFNGVPLSWLNLPLDPNSIKHGSSDLLYSEGIVLTYAGKGAVVASCPDLRVLLTQLVANKYLQGSVSPDGDLALLVGFDTFCSICINNDEKLVSVLSPKTGESIFNGVVKQLKSAAIDRRNNWLILARWTSLVVYDLNKGVLDSPVKTIGYQQPSDSWLSWGFSKNGAYFFYTFKKEGQVLTHVVDVSSGLTRSLKLPISPAVTRVQATLNDDGKLAVIGYDSGSGVAEYCLVDIFSEEAFVNSKKILFPFFSLKIFGGFAGFILGGEAVIAPPSAFNFTLGIGSEGGVSSVNIKVLDDEDRPVSGALVCLGSTCATTSCSGNVTFRVGRNVYTLRVTYPRAETVEYSLDVGRESSTTLVRLKRLYKFAVQGSFNGGFQPAACSFILLNGSRVLSNVTTANCSSVMMVPKGTYTLRVVADKQVFEQFVQISTDSTLVLRAPEVKNLLSVSTILEGSAPQVAIRVYDSSGGLVARSDSGTLSIELPPGLYTVYVEAQGCHNWSTRIELTGSVRLQPTLRAIASKGSETKSSDGWSLSVFLVGAVVLISVAAIFILRASGRGFGSWSKLRSLMDAKLKTRRS